MSSEGALPQRLRTAFERGGEMGRRMRELDWSASPLGPPRHWPDELQTAVAAMLASRAQIVVFYGPEHCALYNDAYIVTMGTKHPAYLGRPGRDMWAEAWGVLQDLFDGVERRDESFWAADYPFMLERHGFLEETYFDISYDPIRAADGSVRGVNCIVTDTTGRVLSERRVRTLSALGRRLTDRPDQVSLGARVAEVLGGDQADLPFAALWLDDPETGGEMTLAGSSGATPSALTGLSLAERDVMAGVLRSGRTDRLSARSVCAAPPPSAADEALVMAIGVGTGNVGVLVVGLSRNLSMDRDYGDFLDLATAQISRAVTGHRAYELQRRRNAELAALDTAKTNFFSNVSHEFRTPLTLILGPLEDLIAAEPGGDLRDRLLLMHRNGLRLLKLVNTVLDFSRLESGRMRAAYRPTDLSAYTARLAGTFSSAIERAGLSLIVEMPPLPAPVHVDREMWEKIVFNLLSNAVKFTREGGITVRLAAAGGAAVLTVADTGVGIPDEEQSLLFDRFHRVTTTWSRSHEGTGIGLALVRELTELHGGTATAVSVAGRGSTFTVRIPFGTAHLPADRVLPDEPIDDELEPQLYVEEAHWWAGESGSAPETSAPLPGAVQAGRRGRILLADDNADLRDHVSRLLRPHFDVVAVTDGLAALEMAARDQFDLVLTDVMMPRLDGFGLIQALRADERTRDVPIVVLSARAGEEASVEGFSAGADDYLVKPFSARDLITRVRANLGLGQVRRQIISRLRGLVDTSAAITTVRTTAEVLEVAARHVKAMTSAGRVVVTAPGARAEVEGGARPGAAPISVLPLLDTEGVARGELSVWAGEDEQSAPEPVLLTQLARLIGLRLENARLYEAEHRIATTLQHSMLPAFLPRMPGAVVSARYLPGSSEAEVGGDWYDVISAPGEKLFLVIGDVVGKGVQAAAGMGQLRNALRAYILEGFNCGDSLSRLNRLVDNLGRRQFATVVCVCFDPRTRMLSYSSAGHPPPVLARQPGEEGTFLYPSAMGPPIGALSDVDYPTREIELFTGERLLLYTDGLVEDRRVGIDVGLAELISDVAKPAEHIDDLLDTLLAKASQQTRRDDIALLAMQVTEPRAFVLRLPADPTRLSVLRRRLDDFLTGHEVPDADVFDLTVAVSEAAANAIEHPIDPAEPFITVEASLEQDAVTVTVRDTGKWRPSTGAGFRGRGLALIGALSEMAVARSDSGTSVTLRRPFTRPV